MTTTQGAPGPRGRGGGRGCLGLRGGDGGDAAGLLHLVELLHYLAVLLLQPLALRVHTPPLNDARPPLAAELLHALLMQVRTRLEVFQIVAQRLSSAVAECLSPV